VNSGVREGNDVGFCESPFSHSAQPWLQNLEKCGSKNLFDKSLTFILGFTI